jgi:hypothetical protein
VSVLLLLFFLDHFCLNGDFLGISHFSLQWRAVILGYVQRETISNGQRLFQLPKKENKALPLGSNFAKLSLF